MTSWKEREARILHALARADQRGERLDFADVVELTSLDERQAEFGVQALLDAGYVAGIDARTMGGFDYLNLRLLPAGRQVLGDWTKESSVDVISMELFISHSSDDAAAAEALVNLVQAALGVPPEEIRCTSVDGNRLPAGASTRDRLRSEIHGATAFIGLLSPKSLSSSFVLFELGARWGADNHLIPLLIRGTRPADVPVPIADLNALDGREGAQVHQLVRDLGRTLDRSPRGADAYERFLQRFTTEAGREEATLRSGMDEPQRRSAILSRLRHEYVLSHDGLSPGLLAGTEPLPKEWTERRLEELGENWRQDEYM